MHVPKDERDSPGTAIEWGVRAESSDRGLLLTVEKVESSKPRTYLVTSRYPPTFRKSHLVSLCSLQVPEMSPILRLDVLLAKIQCASALRSRNPKRSCFILRFSTMASTTRSEDETASPLDQWVNQLSTTKEIVAAKFSKFRSGLVMTYAVRGRNVDMKLPHA